MIEYRTGNMFDSDVDCLVNTVNCEGYMGKGIAYQFKMRFPENNKQYVKECRSGALKPGKLFVFKEEGKTIINFPNLLYKSIYQTICSKKTDEIIFRMDMPVDKAIDFVNSITDDHELEGIATVLFLIDEKERTEEEIWQGFVDWPGDKAARYKGSEMSGFIAVLEAAGFISCNLLGRYEVSNLRKADKENRINCM